MYYLVRLRWANGCLRVVTILLMVWPFSAALAETPATQTGVLATQAASRPASTPPRCALIVDPGMGLDRSPLVGLLEVKLAQQKHVTLLERTEIDKVLREQQLQLLFSPEATSKRAALGQLLKADLLLLLRGAEAKKGAGGVDVVVCETASGLRLRIASVFDGDDNKKVTRVVALLDQSLVVYGGPRRQIVAVPPLVSKDFLHDYDYLGRFFSRTIEEMLVSIPGVVAVELEEARAIAHEQMLTSTQPGVQRPLQALFIWGEYKTSKSDAGPIVSLSLTLRQEEKDLDTRSADSLSQDAAVEFAQKTVRQWIVQASGAASRRDPEAEVRELVARADTLARSVDHLQELNLIEAALLIQPNNSELHFRAARLTEAANLQIIGGYGSDWWDELEKEGGTGERMAEAMLVLSHLRSCIAHVERGFVLSDMRKWEKKYYPLPSGFAGSNIYPRGEPGPIAKRLLSEIDRLEKQYHEMRIRMFKQKVAVGEIDADHIFIYGEDIREDPELRRLVLSVLQYGPDTEFKIIDLVITDIIYGMSLEHKPKRRVIIKLRDVHIDKLLAPEQLKRIEELNQFDGPSARVAAESLNDLIKEARAFLQNTDAERIKGRLEDELRQREAVVYHYQMPSGEYIAIQKSRKQLRRTWSELKPQTTQTRPETSELTFHQLSVQMERDDSQPLGLFMRGWLACQEGVDVAWTGNELFVMKEKGKLKSVCTFKEPTICSHDSWDQVDGVWDGRYAWWPANYAPSPYILALDPMTGRTFRLTREQGLPPINQGLCLAPVGPGQVVAAASFGRNTGQGVLDRAWCALISLDNQGRCSVRMLLEAKEQFDPKSPDNNLTRQTVFAPTALYSPYVPEKGPARWAMLFGDVVAGRNGLWLVDLDKGTAAPECMREKNLGDSPFIAPPFYFGHEGALYVVRSGGGWIRYFHPPDICPQKCVRLTGWPSDRSRAFIPEIRVCASDGRYVYWLAAEFKWGLSRCGDHEILPVAGSRPQNTGGLGNPRLAWSRHYGLVMLTNSGYVEWPSVFQVQVPDAALRRADAKAAEDDATDETNRRTEIEVRAEMQARQQQGEGEQLKDEFDYVFAGQIAAMVVLALILALIVWRGMKRRPAR